MTPLELVLGAVAIAAVATVIEIVRLFVPGSEWLLPPR